MTIPTGDGGFRGLHYKIGPAVKTAATSDAKKAQKTGKSDLGSKKNTVDPEAEKHQEQVKSLLAPAEAPPSKQNYKESY